MTIAAGQARPQSGAPTRSRRRDEQLRLELARRAGVDGTARVTVAELAAAMHTSDRTVQRATIDLVLAGRLEVIRPPGSPQRGVPNVYRIVDLADLRSSKRLQRVCHDVLPTANVGSPGTDVS